MSTALTESVKEVMHARSSQRKYKKGLSIPKETLTDILETTITAPSSWNLQHWKFIVIEEQERKERLLPIANNQQQVVDSSAVIIILGDTEANKNAEEVNSAAVKAGKMPEEVKNTLVNQINQAYEHVENIGVYEAIKNASFAAMQLMLAAKAHGIASGPMGGFNPQALREELKIPDRYIPVLMLPLGYSAEPAHPTMRFPLDRVVIKESF
jgi:nitroreductase